MPTVAKLQDTEVIVKKDKQGVEIEIISKFQELVYNNKIKE